MQYANWVMVFPLEPALYVPTALYKKEAPIPNGIEVNTGLRVSQIKV